LLQVNNTDKEIKQKTLAERQKMVFLCLSMTFPPTDRITVRLITAAVSLIYKRVDEEMMTI